MFKLLVILFTISSGFDGYTTVTRCNPHGPYKAHETGSAWLYGTHPTTLSYTLPAASMQAAAMLLARSHRRPVRFIGDALLVNGIVAHTRGTIHNYSLPKANGGNQ